MRRILSLSRILFLTPTLMASEAVLNLNESNFQTEISSSTVPVIVDFWAEWCGPCRMLTPILEQLAVEKGAAVKVAKVNVDENPHLAAQYGVRSIPMLLFIKDGEVKDTVVGVQSKDALSRKLDALA
ncbi:thioredoxin [Prosthecobacter fusiformis]|uniref:Thioredoxin n=2 Tax=Prosthecobacter fusiformis TaxID=48464 RepID=A0A4R7RHZ9_9BACT|nr:thioredoxin [Prosthecobacter fusiformis]